MQQNPSYPKLTNLAKERPLDFLSGQSSSTQRSKLIPPRYMVSESFVSKRLKYTPPEDDMFILKRRVMKKYFSPKIRSVFKPLQAQILIQRSKYLQRLTFSGAPINIYHPNPHFISQQTQQFIVQVKSLGSLIVVHECFQLDEKIILHLARVCPMRTSIRLCKYLNLSRWLYAAQYVKNKVTHMHMSSTIVLLDERQRKNLANFHNVTFFKAEAQSCPNDEHKLAFVEDVVRMKSLRDLHLNLDCLPEDEAALAGVLSYMNTNDQVRWYIQARVKSLHIISSNLCLSKVDALAIQPTDLSDFNKHYRFLEMGGLIHQKRRKVLNITSNIDDGECVMRLLDCCHSLEHLHISPIDIPVHYKSEHFQHHAESLTQAVMTAWATNLAQCFLRFSIDPRHPKSTDLELLFTNLLRVVTQEAHNLECLDVCLRRPKPEMLADPKGHTLRWNYVPFLDSVENFAQARSPLLRISVDKEHFTSLRRTLSRFPNLHALSIRLRAVDEASAGWTDLFPFEGLTKIQVFGISGSLGSEPNWATGLMRNLPRLQSLIDLEIVNYSMISSSVLFKLARALIKLPTLRRLKLHSTVEGLYGEWIDQELCKMLDENIEQIIATCKHIEIVDVKPIGWYCI